MAQRVPGARALSSTQHEEYAMNTLINSVKTFVDDENGVTAIEYGLIAAMVAAGLGLAITMLTDGLSATFTKIKTALTA